MRFSGFLCTVRIATAFITALPALAVNEPTAAQPATPPEREAYTADHKLLVKLLSVPNPIPMEKYFSLRLAVYDGNEPHRQLSDAQLQVSAGMSHGMVQGFAHEMQSKPKSDIRDGITTVSGMFFHMTGDWTLRVTVHAAGHDETVSFNLPCCGES